MCYRVTFWVFSRLKLKFAQLNDFSGSNAFCVAHVFKCNRLGLMAKSFRGEKACEEKFLMEYFLFIFISVGIKVKCLNAFRVLERHIGFS